MDRGVLGVDRDQPRAGGLGQRGHELAADDQRLLVGQRDVDALGERDDRRAEAGGADDRVEHEVGAGLGDERDQALGAAQDLAAASTASAAQRGGVGIGERDPGHAVLERLRDQLLVAAPGGQADDLERALRARR